MKHNPTLPAPAVPSWHRLMQAFLTMLQTDRPLATGRAVCELFFNDPWFHNLLKRRARQAVNSHAVPSDCLEELEQEISLLFLQRACKTPDLHVKFDVAESRFGGWIWTIIDHLCIEAIRRLHRLYRLRSGLPEELAVAKKEARDMTIDLNLLVAELPIQMQTILGLFNEGYTLKEISELVGEHYWRVCELYRKAVSFLQERLRD